MKTIVELIGPSGIGKSRFLKDQRSLGGLDNWPDLITAIDRVFVSSPAPKANWLPEDLFLLERKLTNTLAEQFNILNRYQHLQNRYRRLHYDVLLRGHSVGYTILDDDHVGHLFTAELVSLAQVDPKAFQRFIQNRAFVFLTRSPQNILRNVRAREAAGEGRAGVSGVSDAVILARTRARLADALALQEICKVLKIPQVSIDLDKTDGDSTSQNRLLTTFLGQFSR